MAKWGDIWQFFEVKKWQIFVKSIFGQEIVIVGNTVKLTAMDFLLFFPEEIIIILISKKSRGQEYYVEV